MSLTVPLAVRLSTTRGYRDVTPELFDLTFRSTAPGGFASATMALSRRLDLQPDEIAAFGRVVVYDTRDGTTVWEGRIEDTGRSSGDSGSVWQLGATGPAAHALDRTISVIYVDSTLNSWSVGSVSTPAVDVIFDDSNNINMRVPNNVTWGTGLAGLAVYHALEYTGQQVAKVWVPYSATFTSPNMDARLSTSIGNGSSVHLDNQALTSPPGFLQCARGGTNPIPSGHDTVRLRFVRNVSNITPSDDNVTVSYGPIVVRGLLKDAAGSDITSGYISDYVNAQEVVADLLGRLLPKFDGPNATIETDNFPIAQLAYPDGASAQKVLEDLMLILPAYYWAAWEQRPDTGLYRFEWKSWPINTVRYEADTIDGFDSPASASELYNAVSVRWRNAGGIGITTRRTSTVAELTAAGLTREWYIDLGDEVGNSANATQVGDQFLAEHNVPVNAGTLTVTRPITDFQTGRQIMPWEIRPGHLIRVRDVMPRVDALNPNGRDGVTIFRVAAVEFNAGQAAATLELDTYPLTVARAVADLNKRRIVRKR